MDLNSIINTGIQTAFSTVDGQLTPMVYVRRQYGDYDTTLGSRTVVETRVSIKPLVVHYKEKEIDGDRIKAADLKLLLPVSILSFDIETADVIEYKDSVWDIIRQAVKVNVMYELQIRVSK